MWLSEWRTGDGRIELGVNELEGACFLSEIRGQFNHPDDQVWIEIIDGQYVIDGNDLSGGEMGATARCIWYD